MRRNAFLGHLVKLLIYAAIVIIFIWMYLNYVAPILNKLLDTMQQIQNTGTSAQVQIADWQKTIDEFRSKIPGLAPVKPQ